MEKLERDLKGLRKRNSQKTVGSLLKLEAVYRGKPGDFGLSDSDYYYRLTYKFCIQFVMVILEATMASEVKPEVRFGQKFVATLPV